MPLIGIHLSKAPRACSWSNARLQAGRSAGGSTYRRSRPKENLGCASRSIMNKPERPGHALSIRLPRANRTLEAFRLSAPRNFPKRAASALNRIAFAAVHVVADPLADADPWLTAAIDWDRTIAFREHIWDLGLGVAEAMDNAQRGAGVGWPTSLELIRRSVAAARARGGLVFSGCGTDHLDPEAARGLEDVVRAY